MECWISVDRILLDRHKTSRKRVRAYARMLQEGLQAPPIAVSLTGSPRSWFRFQIEDGRNRLVAARLAGRHKILANIVAPGRVVTHGYPRGTPARSMARETP